jgi:hypothetical protein
MSRIDKIKEGDLLVNRTTKKPYIVLEIKRYTRKAYGSSGPPRKAFKLFSPEGKQFLIKDIALKVEYYLPGEPYFDDIR